MGYVVNFNIKLKLERMRKERERINNERKNEKVLYVVRNMRKYEWNVK